MVPSPRPVLVLAAAILTILVETIFIFIIALVVFYCVASALFLYFPGLAGLDASSGGGPPARHQGALRTV